MSIGTAALAFVAGTLSVLSPCVLPILPIVLGTAASKQRLGPVALAAGLSISFVVIGLFVATVGHTIGLNGEALRMVAAALVVIVGAVLVLPPLQARLAVASGPIAAWTDQHLGTGKGDGLWGQFWIGALLGAIWSPCVGPTLGAASLLAAQGRDLPQVAVTMLAFGVGAALPLLAFGIISRETALRWRHRLLAAGQGSKTALGVFLVMIGAVILLGLDKTVETLLVDISPQWLTDLTTRF